MKTASLILSGALLLVGCASSYHFVPYVGRQQEWKTSPGSLMETNGILPIYYGCPAIPYVVLGSITTDSRSVQMASREARRQGGQALILLDSDTRQVGSVNFPGSTYTTGSMVGNQFYGNSFSSPGFSAPVIDTSKTFAVIKFK